VNTESQLFAGSLALAAVLSAGLGLASGWLLRRRPAPVRYGLMLAALSMASLGPLLVALAQRAKLSYLQIDSPVVAPQTEQPAATPMVGSPATPSAQPKNHSAVPLPPIHVRVTANTTPTRPWWPIIGTLLCLAWIAGTTIGLARIVWSIVRLRRFMRTLTPCESLEAQAALGNAATQLCLRRRPALLESRVAPVPMVMGLFRPAVVLPADLVRSIDAGQLQAIFLHEAAHIAHCDLWIGLFQRLAGVLFWWCPLVHLLNRRISDLREDICDNYVLQTQGDGLRLAEVLVDLAQRAHGVHFALSVGAMGVIDERPGLRGRIERLLHEQRNTMTRMNRFALLGTFGFSLLVGGAILATTLRAADQIVVADPSKKDVLSTDDFWEKTGQQSKHDFDAATTADIQRIASDSTATAVRRLRATKLACDLGGRTRLREDLGAETSDRAIGVAMKHLEANLADPTVKKFSPEKGFAHIGVSSKDQDPAAIWVLIESVEEKRRGGLNIRIDPATWKVTQIDFWGKPQADAEKKAAWNAKFALTIADGKERIAVKKDLNGVAGENVHIDAGPTHGVDLVIQTIEAPEGTQYAATIKVTKADAVLAMPKILTLPAQEATFTIDGGKENQITATLTIADKAGPATAPATKPAGTTPLGK
jgi:beta-lactamase regulating signal transducer with metallopeptidase domain